MNNKVIMGLMLALIGCSTLGGRESAPVTPAPMAVPASDRYHPDMSKMYGLRNSCEGLYAPMSQIVSWVGTPANGRVAALVRVIEMGAPRWNTRDGRRPTQAEADAMVNDRNDMPRIFRPLTLAVDRVLAGEPLSGRIVGFAEGGKIGKDEMNSCGFGSPVRFQIRETNIIVTVGESYLAILGNEMLTGRATGPLHEPVINDLYLIREGKVVGLNGTLEPLP
jgi:hypothetical protein